MADKGITTQWFDYCADWCLYSRYGAPIGAYDLAMALHRFGKERLGMDSLLSIDFEMLLVGFPIDWVGSVTPARACGCGGCVGACGALFSVRSQVSSGIGGM